MKGMLRNLGKAVLLSLETTKKQMMNKKSINSAFSVCRTFFKGLLPYRKHPFLHR